MKIKIIFFLFVLSKNPLCAQVSKDSFFIIFKPESINPEIKNTKIQILQEDRIIKFDLYDKVKVKGNKEFSVEFVNNKITIANIKYLKISNDTTYFIGSTTLEAVIVKSKKKLISENTQGFIYYPQNDSILKEKSILMGLQRLPFINAEGFNDIPKYRQNGKILFLINGKQKKGIENNWAAILQVVKGKDVYKVELIEDIPTLIKNQGYAAIINILTIDENIYGFSFNTASLFDQRNNINPSVSSTLLRKRFDVSLSFSKVRDNQNGEKKTEIFQTGSLISVLDVKSKYIFDNNSLNLDIGFRKDSLKDYGLNVSFQNTNYNTNFIIVHQLGINTNNISDRFNQNLLNTNFSYINRKKKGITQSLISSINFVNQSKGNNTAYFLPKNSDSIAIRARSKEFNWVAEYNIEDVRNKKYPKEYGLKIYNKLFNQGFSLYDLDLNTNGLNQLLYNKTDSFITSQISINPYLRWINNISKVKRFTISFYPELLLVKNNDLKSTLFFIPSVILRYRKILNSNNSLRYSFTARLSKPNVDYLSTIQLLTNPQQQQIGNPNLKLSKYLGISTEWVRRKKSTFSYTLSMGYSYDNLSFFKVVNPNNNLIQNIANNGGTGFGFTNSFNYQKQILRKIWFDTYSGMSIGFDKNRLYNTKFNRITFNNQTDVRYELGGKNGTLALRIFYSSNPTNGQGYEQGTRMYGLWYAKQIFKNKFALTLLADKFFLKNINRLSYSKNNQFEVYTNNIEPYRLLKIRVAYNFSNIKVFKNASKKTTEISGEIPR
jgi:hypothetical protein